MAQPSSWAVSLSCWPRARGDGKERTREVGQGGQVAPEFLELGDGEDVLLAVTPPPLDVLDGDVGRHPGGGRPDGGGHLGGVGPEVVPRDLEGVEQAVEIDPRGQAVVITEGELRVLTRLGEPFEESEAAVDPGQPAAAVVDPPGDDLEPERPAGGDGQAEDAGVEVRPEGVDVVDQEPAEVGVARSSIAARTPLRKRVGTS